MFCVSIAESSPAACMEALKGLSFAEIRMDLMDLSLQDVRTLFACPVRLIATCRPGMRPEAVRKALLLSAIESGAGFVDVELDAGEGYRQEIVTRARAHGCSIIISYHNYEGTPGRDELGRVIASCFHAGADIAKVACAVRVPEDNARLLGLLDDAGKIVVVGMGRAGRITRIIAPLLGSPFTFASLCEGRETAEGQIDVRTVERLVRMLSTHTGVEEGQHG